MKTPKTIYLIRHCEAEGQEPNAKLTSNGLTQAIKLADLLEKQKIEYIITSTYSRALESIKPLADRLDIPINQDERLIERVLSEKNLPNWQELLENTFIDLEISYEGGESSKQATERGIAALKECVVRSENTIAVVTHGNLLILLLKYFYPYFGFKEWKQLSNPDVFLMNFQDNEVMIKRIWRN